MQDAKPDFEADVFEAGWEAKIVLKFYESMLRSDLTLKQTLQVRRGKESIGQGILQMYERMLRKSDLMHKQTPQEMNEREGCWKSLFLGLCAVR